MPERIHHEHGVMTFSGDGDVECCICPDNPCEAVTVADVMRHREYDIKSARRSGEADARIKISNDIAEAAPCDNPDHYDDDAYVAATESFRRCWDIARGDIDNPPF